MNEQNTVNTTDAELEEEFIERNQNLKRSWNHIIDKIDHAAKTTHDSLVVPEDSIGSTSMTVDSNTSGSSGAFNTGGTGSIFGVSRTNGSNTAYDETIDTTLNTTRRRPSIIGEQTSRQSGWGITLDHKLMNSINNDIRAMHSTDAEEFEGVASKFDETFGANALV